MLENVLAIMKIAPSNMIPPSPLSVAHAKQLIRTAKTRRRPHQKYRRPRGNGGDDDPAATDEFIRTNLGRHRASAKRSGSRGGEAQLDERAKHTSRHDRKQHARLQAIQKGLRQTSQLQRRGDPIIHGTANVVQRDARIGNWRRPADGHLWGHVALRTAAPGVAR